MATSQRTQHLLRAIRDSAQAFIRPSKRPRFSSPDRQSQIPSPRQPELPDDLIPPPPDITAQLFETGISPIRAQQLSDIYLKAVHELHADSESGLRWALQRRSFDMQANKLINTWTMYFDEKVQQWTQKTINEARAHASKSHDLCESSKPQFNHASTPLLERYFERNAYPSAADRAVLAKKTRMTPRQIEVWFQNHRNRARKEGKVLRKLHPPKCHNVEQSSDESPQMPVVSRPPTPTSPLIVHAVPSHAYPAKYHDRSHPALPDPTTFQFSESLWLRATTRRRPTRHLSTDMSEFTNMFSTQLRICDDPRKRTDPKLPKPLSDNWLTVATYTEVLPAPLPALLPQKTIPVRTTHLKILPATKKQRQNAFCHGYTEALAFRPMPQVQLPQQSLDQTARSHAWQGPSIRRLLPPPYDAVTVSAPWMPPTIFTPSVHLNHLRSTMVV